MRIVSLATLAEQEEFCRLMSTLKGPQSSLHYIYGCSQSKFLEVCCRTLRNLEDTKALSRCGMTTSFPEVLTKTLTPRSPQVLYESSLATRLQRCAWQLVTNMVASHTAYTHGYPGKFAGIVDAATQEKTMHEAQKDIAAWQASKAHVVSVALTE